MKIKEMMTNEELSVVSGGGETIYYGNGLYCHQGGSCYVNLSQTWTSIANNSAMNILTGGSAGWHSGGIA